MASGYLLILGVLLGLCGGAMGNCTGNSAVCPVNTSCHLIQPPFSACVCSTGYRLSREGECVDINECAVNRTLCSPNQMCMNTPGSFSCVTKNGHTPRLTFPTSVTVSPPTTPRPAMKTTTLRTVPTTTRRPAFLSTTQTTVTLPWRSRSTLKPTVSTTGLPFSTAQSTPQAPTLRAVTPNTSRSSSDSTTANANIAETVDVGSARKQSKVGKRGFDPEKKLIVGLSCGIGLLVLAVLCIVVICGLKNKRRAPRFCSPNDEARKDAITTSADKTSNVIRDSLGSDTVTLNDIYTARNSVSPKASAMEADVTQQRYWEAMSTGSWGSDAFSVDFSLDGDGSMGMDDGADVMVDGMKNDVRRKGRLPAIPNNYIDMDKSVRKVNYPGTQGSEFTEGLEDDPPPQYHSVAYSHYANVAV